MLRNHTSESYAIILLLNWLMKLLLSAFSLMTLFMHFVSYFIDEQKKLYFH